MGRRMTELWPQCPVPPPVSRRHLLALAAASPLAACASTPDVNAMVAGDDGQLKRAILGSRGPLSNSERGAVLSSLSPDLSADALQRQFALQQALSQSPLVTGNTATILRDGAQALPAMFAAMQAARDHINLEYFIFADVVCNGTSLSDVLTDRLRNGVTVNIIYDAYGSADTPPALFDTLRAAGARVVTFNPLDPLRAKAGWSPNDRDHRKIMVVDGRVGFTGGINLDKVYENPASVGDSAGRQHQACLLARHRGAHRGPGGRRTAKGVLRHLDAAERPAGCARATTSRRCRAPACRPSASSPARRAISGRSTTSR